MARPLRSSLLLLAALALASCDGDKPATPALSAAPEHAQSAAPSGSALAAAPSGAPSAEASGDPSAEANAAPPASGAASGAPAGSAAVATKKGEIAIPTPAGGIMAPGAADKILKSGQKPIVRLISDGAEPKSALSYTFSKGPTRPLAVSLDMLMGLKSPGKTLPPTTVPRMTMTLELNPAEKNAEGDWKIDAKLRGVTVEPKGDQEKQIADAMRPQLDGMKGLTMAYWVSPHGNVHDVKVDLPPGFPAQAQQMLQGMNQSFESMVAPLPADPVGLGAKWQVVTRLGSSGADLLQFATFTLKSREGTKVGVDVTLKQLAASDQIKAPGMPAGVSAKVKSFNSGGSGTNKIDTKDVAPEAGALTVKSQMELGVGQGASAAESMAIESTLTVTFSRPEK